MQDKINVLIQIRPGSGRYLGTHACDEGFIRFVLVAGAFKMVHGYHSREGTLPSAAQRGASRHRPPTLGLLLLQSLGALLAT